MEGGGAESEVGQIGWWSREGGGEAEGGDVAERVRFGLRVNNLLFSFLMRR